MHPRCLHGQQAVDCRRSHALNCQSDPSTQHATGSPGCCCLLDCWGADRLLKLQKLCLQCSSSSRMLPMPLGCVCPCCNSLLSNLCMSRALGFPGELCTPESRGCAWVAAGLPFCRAFLERSKDDKAACRCFFDHSLASITSETFAWRAASCTCAAAGPGASTTSSVPTSCAAAVKVAVSMQHAAESSSSSCKGRSFMLRPLAGEQPKAGR